MTDKIQYVKRSHIDPARWDRCIEEASNGLIYGYSFYLDHLSKNWDALIYNDYEYVMPLTWNKKYSFYYLYQPAFIASLGIFGKKPDDEIVQMFINNIPSKFRLVEISLNYGNHLSGTAGIYQRVNYTLNLERTFDQLRSQFRQNVIRNSQKAAQAGCRYATDIEIDPIIDLSKQLIGHLPGINTVDYSNFKALYDFLKKSGKSITRGVLSQDDKLISSAVLFLSHGRVYYILVGNHPNGKTIGASHFLIENLIKEYAGQSLLLDFEGSDIKNLAFFYLGFGASEEYYQAIKWNRLPWWIRWVK